MVDKDNTFHVKYMCTLKARILNRLEFKGPLVFGNQEPVLPVGP
jgi:hypothetical protein